MAQNRFTQGLFFSLCFIVTVVFSQNGLTFHQLGGWSGYAHSHGGDINGDKIDDIIIGTPWGESNGINNTGRSYVIFGNGDSEYPFQFDLNALDGENGFIINGIGVNQYSGCSISIEGDVNGDGIHDILIGASWGQPYGMLHAGQSYVIFGRNTSSFPSQFNLSSLDGSNGFTINGIAPADEAGRRISSGGDVNGDGIHDILIGGDHAVANGITDSGQFYVVFGTNTSSFPSQFNLSSLNGSNGFTINGTVETSYLGSVFSLSLGGDVNGDGLDDILIGAPYVNTSNGVWSGQSYVIYGRNTSTSPFPLFFNLNSLNGSNGFIMVGHTGYVYAGWSVSFGGDVNGDKIDDILIGSYYQTQQSVIFGRNTSFPLLFNLTSLNGINGFKINASTEYNDGYSVSIGGDVNGDGVDDILIGNPDANTTGGIQTGQSYVIFGRNSSSFPATMDVTSLNGKNGFVIKGTSSEEMIGGSVSIRGDVNGDRCDDILIGRYDPNGHNDSLNHNKQYKSYLIFGQNTSQTSFPATINPSILKVSVYQQFKNITVEIEQHFSFSIQNGSFISWIGQPLTYSATLSSQSLPSWLNFSQTDIKFEGQSNQTGSFPLTVFATSKNGDMTAQFMLNVVPKQRQFEIPPDQTQSFSFQVPDPSGGTFQFEAQQASGDPLPSFLNFNSTSNALSLNTTIKIQPQTVFVTIIGKDDNGDEQVRYDYTLVFYSNSSESDVNIGAIVGGTVGGVFLLMLIVIIIGLVVMFVLKRRSWSSLAGKLRAGRA